MRRILVASLVVGVGVLAASVPAVADIGARWMATEAKAERLLVRDATIRLAPTEKTALEQQLGDKLRDFYALEVAAVEELDLEAYSLYASISARYLQALRSVQGGLDVKHAGCQGTGRSLRGSRFERFQCLVTSGVLAVPSVEIDYSGATPLPSVIEHEPREVGPLSTQYRVRITGPSSIQYR